jgi:hypothetical protein
MREETEMTIKLEVAIVGTDVVVTAGGRDASIVRGRSGRRLVWETTPSVSRFDLEFFRVTEGDGVADLQPDWPFVSSKAKPGNADDEFDGKVNGATKFAGRLAADPGIYKYTISATPSVGGPPIVLDPQIIIDR